MVKLVSAKCPSCGAALQLSKEDEKVKCKYCQQTIIVDDAIACYKLKISGTVNVDGIESNADLISAANELLDMNEYLKAKRKFLEFSEKNPDNYQGWLGLLICRTRNFTIRDNNIMFENDINNYYEHFLKVAPENIKNEYEEIMKNYLNATQKKETVKISDMELFSNNESWIKRFGKSLIPAYFLVVSIIGILTAVISLIGDGRYVFKYFCLAIMNFSISLILKPSIKAKFNISTKNSIIIAIIIYMSQFLLFL